MENNTKRAVYTNLLLLAQADGKVEAAELAYLQKVVTALGITDEEVARWKEGVRFGETEFMPVKDVAAAETAVTLLARMVRVDNDFSPAEQEAYLALGKALGFSPEALGPVLRKVWNKDPDEILKELTASIDASTVSLLIVQDDIRDTTAVERAAPTAALTFTNMASLAAVQSAPPIVVFHAAEDKDTSTQRLRLLQDRFKGAFVTFIARRDQAAQIGHLLGAGAKRCFVEPLFPGEIDKAFVGKGE